MKKKKKKQHLGEFWGNAYAEENFEMKCNILTAGTINFDPLWENFGGKYFRYFLKILSDKSNLLGEKNLKIWRCHFKKSIRKILLGISLILGGDYSENVTNFRKTIFSLEKIFEEILDTLIL